MYSSWKPTSSVLFKYQVIYASVFPVSEIIFPLLFCQWSSFPWGLPFSHRSVVFEPRCPAAGPFSCFHMSGFPLWNDSVRLLPCLCMEESCMLLVCTCTAQGAKGTRSNSPRTHPAIPGDSPSEAAILPPMWSVTGIFLLLHELTNWPFPESR